MNLFQLKFSQILPYKTSKLYTGHLTRFVVHIAFQKYVYVQIIATHRCRRALWIELLFKRLLVVRASEIRQLPAIVITQKRWIEVAVVDRVLLEALFVRAGDSLESVRVADVEYDYLIRIYFVEVVQEAGVLEQLSRIGVVLEQRLES